MSHNPVRLRRGVLTLLAMAFLVPLLAVPATAADYVPVSGAGSTWSQNAIDQWRRNVAQYGLTVNYQGTGSSDGRNQFRNGTVDFAVSEIPYGLSDSGVVDTPPQRGYAYMPIVAGGTSFMYNLQIGGRKVTNLRLSGPVLAKIFTGVITNWADPAIKVDNPGLTLPARKIVPVVRSDGSGSTAQFTLWMSKRHSPIWDDYCRKAGRQTPCGLTSNYPVVPGTGFTAQSGSLGVAGYVAQAQNVGTITYVEYSYALNSGYPVAKVLNDAGYYVEPTAQNVAVALLQARINTTPGPNYLTQILDGVYANRDPRTYPLSSYSYMLVPTKVEANFSPAKGKSLSSFANYFLCEGQQQAPVLGYSPLPINLVEAGLSQVRRIPGADVASVDIKKCNNPTFSSDGSNTLAKSAPQPDPADKIGAVQSTKGTGGAKNTTTRVNPPRPGTAVAGTTPGGTTPGGTTPGGATVGGTTPGGATVGGTTPGGATVGGTTPGGGAAAPGAPAAGAGPVVAPTVDPVTGVVADAAAQPAAGVVVASDVVAQPVSVTAAGNSALPFAALAALLLMAVVLGPALVARLLSRRGDA